MELISCQDLLFFINDKADEALQIVLILAGGGLLIRAVRRFRLPQPSTPSDYPDSLLPSARQVEVATSGLGCGDAGTLPIAEG